MASPLDDTDRRILDALTRDGRMSMRTLAETAAHLARQRLRPGRAAARRPE